MKCGRNGGVARPKPGGWTRKPIPKPRPSHKDALKLEAERVRDHLAQLRAETLARERARGRNV